MTNKEKDIEAIKSTEEMIKTVEKDEIDVEKREREKIIKNLESSDKQASDAAKEESDTKYDARKSAIENWVPKTELGRLVKSGKIKNIDEILDSGRKILESEIVDSLVPLTVEFLNVGQAKGKFGGGKRRGWRQTQKKTEDKNIITFSVMAVVGDGDGHIGIGFGRAAETLPAKEKATRKAKLNITRIKRGCASYDCSCKELHSIPFTTEGKCSSVRIRLMPAPQGTGLVTGDEVKRILKLAGISDVYGKSFGKTKTTINVGRACMQALNKLNDIETI